MRLNYECISDIMFYLEDNLDFSNTMQFKDIIYSGLNKKYSENDISYCLSKIDEMLLISCSYKTIGEERIIKDITLQGHEFLRYKREGKAWDYRLVNSYYNYFK